MSAAPFSIVMVLLCVSTLRALRAEAAEAEAPRSDGTGADARPRTAEPVATVPQARTEPVTSPGAAR